MDQILVLHAIFNEVDINLRNLADTEPVFVQKTSSLRPLPVQGRGHYFDGATYWEVDTSETAPEIFYLHHRFTIAMWVKVLDATASPTLFSKNKATPSAENEENLLKFFVTDQQKLAISIDNGSVEINYTQTEESV